MKTKKLATLLALTVMIGQANLPDTQFAQADTLLIQATGHSQETDSQKVASVIQHPPDVEGQGELPDSKPATPDVYTISNGEGVPATTLEAVKHDDTSAGLMVNGIEALRLRDDADAYTRVKTIMDRLNRMLVTGEAKAATLKPGLEKKQAVIRFGDEVLATVDAASAKAAKYTPERLAFIWTNRLRDSLGENALEAKEFPAMAAAEQPVESYKSTGRSQAGMASWYGPGFHGRRTASGARFNQHALTAAHRTLPFGTLVRVTNQRNKRSCVVKINDRGPYAHGRIIDLSSGAARRIGISGVGRVTLEVVNKS